MENIGDLLTADSLLLTVIGILYGQWYGEIRQAISAKIPQFKADRGDIRKTVNQALFGKALPLAIAAVPLAIIYVPNAWSIGIAGIFQPKGSAHPGYNAINATFCFVVLLSVLLASHIIYLFIKLVGQSLTICNKPEDSA